MDEDRDEGNTIRWVLTMNGRKQENHDSKIQRESRRHDTGEDSNKRKQDNKMYMKITAR